MNAFIVGLSFLGSHGVEVRGTRIYVFVVDSSSAPCSVYQATLQPSARRVVHEGIRPDHLCPLVYISCFRGGPGKVSLGVAGNIGKKGRDRIEKMERKVGGPALYTFSKSILMTWKMKTTGHPTVTRPRKASSKYCW